MTTFTFSQSAKEFTKRQPREELGREKCEFMQEELIFFGHNIDLIGSTPTEAGIVKLTNYERPTNLKQLKGLLGYTKWYRDRIKD